MPPLLFLLPIVPAFVASLLEGVSVGLLVPLANGIMHLDFGFVRDLPYLKKALDHLPQGYLRDHYIFAFLLGVIFLSSLAKNALQYVATFSTAHIVRRFSHNMRLVIFDRYLEFGKLFFDRNSTGNLHHILMNFTQEIAGRLKNCVHMLNYLFMLIIYLTIMFFIAWQLTLFALVLFPVLHYSLGWIVEKIKKTSNFHAMSQSDLSKEIYNVLSCIPLVKLQSNEKEEK